MSYSTHLNKLFDGVVVCPIKEYSDISTVYPSYIDGFSKSYTPEANTNSLYNTDTYNYSTDSTHVFINKDIVTYREQVFGMPLLDTINSIIIRTINIQLSKTIIGDNRLALEEELSPVVIHRINSFLTNERDILLKQLFLYTGVTDLHQILYLNYSDVNSTRLFMPYNNKEKFSTYRIIGGKVFKVIYNIKNTSNSSHINNFLKEFNKHGIPKEVFKYEYV